MSLTGLDFWIQEKEYVFMPDLEPERLRFGEALISIRSLDLSPIESIAADVPEPTEIPTPERKKQFEDCFSKKRRALPMYSRWQKDLFRRIFERMLENHDEALRDPEKDPGYLDGTEFFLDSDFQTSTKPASEMLMQDLATDYINAINRNVEGALKIIRLFLTKDRTLGNFFAYHTSVYLQSCDVRLVYLDNKFTKIYSVPNFLALAIWDIANIMEYEVAIKRCANCRKLFVPLNRSDTKYCSATAPQDNSKTCQEYGAYSAWLNKTKDDEVYGIYRKKYMQKQMAMKRNPDIATYASDFESFKEQTEQWKRDVQSGDRSREDYLAWLQER